VDIKAFVRELLFSHDCVIIPGFGGFIGNYSPAGIDRFTGLFHPPVKRISFNVKLSHNDGLLISRISQAKGLKYGDSRRLVEEFAADLNRKLARREKVVFDHLGTISANSEHRLQFEPETDINYLPGSYGLESFQCMPLSDYDVRRRVTRHIDRDPVRLTHLRRNLWRAAVIVPILALLVAVPLKTGLFKSRVDTLSLNPLVTAEFENNKKAVDESVKLTADSFPAGPATNEPVVSDSSHVKAVVPEQAAPENVPAETPSNASYVIVTGSFKSEENAMTHVRALQADGFKPEIVKAPNGYFRVYALKCQTMETALYRKDSISKKFPDTWITRN
jgi:nucleoid DNA-binding protein